MERCKLDVFEIDNTVNNLGVMRSHNLGVDEMRRRDADWLVIMGASIRFGDRGGLDFIEALDEHPNDNVVEGAGVYGWHLIAFHKDTLNRVGKWDANFSPYGFDDIDMSMRIQKCFNSQGKYPSWEKVPVDVTDTTMGHSLKLGGVEAPAAPRLLYFVEKWGRHPGASELTSYDNPFNEPKNHIGYWPEYEGSRWND